MLYLGFCHGDAPPVCVPCLPACCRAWLAGDSLYNTDVFAEDWQYYTAPSPWRSGVSGPVGASVLVTITGISHTLTIPSEVEVVSLCGPLVRSASEDFSGLTVTVTGNAVAISGSVVILGTNAPGSPFGAMADLVLGVLCQAAGRTYLVELRWRASANQVNGTQDLTGILPVDCADPCMPTGDAYTAGYNDGLACLEQADPCAGTCPDCSTAYLDGWTAGRAAAGGCSACGDFSTGYTAGYYDGLAHREQADPCGAGCSDCSAGYSAGYADGWIDGNEE
jgi:hypothetical protein